MKCFICGIFKILEPIIHGNLKLNHYFLYFKMIECFIFGLSEW